MAGGWHIKLWYLSDKGLESYDFKQKKNWSKKYSCAKYINTIAADALLGSLCHQVISNNGIDSVR